MEEKKTYSVVGTVTIGTDEYRDLIERATAHDIHELVETIKYLESTIRGHSKWIGNQTLCRATAIFCEKDEEECRKEAEMREFQRFQKWVAESTVDTVESQIVKFIVGYGLCTAFNAWRGDMAWLVEEGDFND